MSDDNKPFRVHFYGLARHRNGKSYGDHVDVFAATPDAARKIARERYPGAEIAKIKLYKGARR